MPILADFPRAMSLGFAQGTQMAEGQNPLGQFIRMMLADWQQKRAVSQEVALKEETEIAKEKRERESPLYAAQIKAYEALSTQRTEGLIDEEIKREAWVRYKQGDRSPEVLKSLGKWVSPMETMIAQSMGFGGIGDTNIPAEKPSGGGRIRVKKKNNNQVGSILEKDFNPAIYEKL